MIIGIGHEAGFADVPDARFMRNMLAGFISALVIAGSLFCGSCAAAQSTVSTTNKGKWNDCIRLRTVISVLPGKMRRKSSATRNADGWNRALGEPQIRRTTEERLSKPGGDGSATRCALVPTAAGKLAAAVSAKLGTQKAGDSTGNIRCEAARTPTIC
jgi:hypothetical protein